MPLTESREDNCDENDSYEENQRLFLHIKFLMGEQPNHPNVHRERSEGWTCKSD
jgi:hypothetical protein